MIHFQDLTHAHEKKLINEAKKFISTFLTDLLSEVFVFGKCTWYKIFIFFFLLDLKPILSSGWNFSSHI